MYVDEPYVPVVGRNKDTLCDVDHVTQSNDHPKLIADKYIVKVGTAFRKTRISFERICGTSGSGNDSWLN